MKIVDFNTKRSPEDYYFPNIFISHEWLQIISETYQFKFYAVEKKGKIILPFCILGNGIEKIKSVPFGDYTFINYSNDLLIDALEFLKNQFTDKYIETTIVSNKPTQVNNFNLKPTGFLIQVDVEEWRKSLVWKEAYERNIKNAINQGVEININQDINSIDAFYQLHEQLRINKFRKLPQPLLFFKNIYNRLISTKKGFFLEAKLHGEVIASWLIIKYDKVLYYKFGASNKNYLRYRPNDLLFRSLMQYARDNGFKKVDLGFSGASKVYEGLIRFKSKEGGLKTPIFQMEYYPENFDFVKYGEYKDRLRKITEDAIEQGDINKIRTISNNMYGQFV